MSVGDVTVRVCVASVILTAACGAGRAEVCENANDEPTNVESGRAMTANRIGIFIRDTIYKQQYGRLQNLGSYEIPQKAYPPHIFYTLALSSCWINF